jgi:hypothetical protein
MMASGDLCVDLQLSATGRVCGGRFHPCHIAAYWCEGSAARARYGASGGDRRHERPDADDVHDACQIVSENAECHFAGSQGHGLTSVSELSPAQSWSVHPRFLPSSHQRAATVKECHCLTHALQHGPPYSITLSACRRIGGGMVRPRAVALQIQKDWRARVVGGDRGRPFPW